MALFQNSVQGVEEIATRIPGATPVDVVDGTDGAWFVPWFTIAENAGGTPTVTIALTNGTITTYFAAGGVTMRSKALTANQSYEFDKGYVVPVGWFLRITSVTGSLDVMGVKVKRVPG